MSNLPETSFPNSVAIGTDCPIPPPPTIYIFGSQKLSPAKVVEKAGQIMSLPLHCLERKTYQIKAYKNQSIIFENSNLLAQTVARYILQLDCRLNLCPGACKVTLALDAWGRLQCSAWMDLIT